MERQAYEHMARLEDRHWWFVARRRIVREMIARLIMPPSGARVLEAGCGTGGNLEMLSEFGDVAAFEPDERARRLAIEKFPADIRAGSLPDDIPFSSRERFDLIVMLDVLEHLEKDVESLRRLLQLLKPSGHLLLTVPALPWLWSAHDELHHHKRRYERHHLMATMRDAGASVRKMSYFNTLLLPPIAIMRLLSKLNGGDRLAAGLTMPPAVLNGVLLGLFGSERKLLTRVNLPVGVSLLAIAQRG